MLLITVTDKVVMSDKSVSTLERRVPIDELIEEVKMKLES